MFILEKFNDTWNYTFIAVAFIAIGIGTFLTIRKMKKEEKNKHRDIRNEKRQQKGRE